MDEQEIFTKIKQVFDEQRVDTDNMTLSSDFEAVLGS